MTDQLLSGLDFADLVAGYAETFPTIQVLAEDGSVVDDAAIQGVEDDTWVSLMRDLVWAHAFDERMIVLNRQGTLGNYAPAGGQEASQYATLAALRDGDFLLPTYRDLGPLIKHGLPMHQAFLWWKGHLQGNAFPADFQAYVAQVIVGGSIPHAAGVALGKKLNGNTNVVMAYCGDGATSQGDFYEGLNFAGVYKAPLIVVVQNNQYAISVPVAKQTAAHTLAQKGVAAGIPALRIDGMDPMALYLATAKAREWALAGNGPVLIEALTYRIGSHTMSDDPKRYRSDDEVAAWEGKASLARLRKYLEAKQLWDEDKAAEIADGVRADIKAALAEMGKTKPMTVPDLLQVMYEEAPRNITEQIAAYQAKEN